MFFFPVCTTNVQVRRALLTSLLQVSFYNNVDVQHCNCLSYRIHNLYDFHVVLGYSLYGQPDMGATQDLRRSIRKTGLYISVRDCDRYSNCDVLEALHQFQTRVVKMTSLTLDNLTLIRNADFRPWGSEMCKFHARLGGARFPESNYYDNQIGFVKTDPSQFLCRYVAHTYFPDIHVTPPTMLAVDTNQIHLDRFRKSCGQDTIVQSTEVAKYASPSFCCVISRVV